MMSRKHAVVSRVAADILMVSVSLASGMLIRMLVDLLHDQPHGEGTSLFVRSYVTGAGQFLSLLVPVAILVFWAAGFYTHSRTYQSRYKALVVAYAVTLAYVLAAFGWYFVAFQLPVQRSTLLAACGVNIVLSVSARLWMVLARWFHVAFASSPVAVADHIRTVLVIGGGGYIGTALIPMLLDAGWRVRVLDLLIYGEEPLLRVGVLDKIELIRADFRHIERVVEATRGVDAVIHLGGIVGDPACALDEEKTIDVNLVATRMLAEVAKGLGVDRFVFASTCSVYGATDEMLDEHSHLNPVSLYARSKIASEVILRRLASRSFAPVILRFGTIYGLSGRTRFDLVVNLMTARALWEGEITVAGGQQWRPFLHVEDAARSILLVLQAPRDAVFDQVFNVGSDKENYRIGDVAALVRQQVPAARIVIADNSADRRNYRVSFARIRRVLGFSPTWTVTDGIRQVLVAMKSGDISDYRDVRYSNVRVLSEEPRRIERSDFAWVDELLSATGEPFETRHVPAVLAPGDRF